METEPGGGKLKEATMPGRGKKRPPSPASSPNEDDGEDSSMSTSDDDRWEFSDEEQEEEENDEEEDQDTATSRGKKSKTKDEQMDKVVKILKQDGMRPAVRAMENNMRLAIEISRNKLAVMQSILHERNAIEEDARKATERKVKKVKQLAAECGVTPEKALELFKGVVNIVQVESVMDLLIRTTPAGRLIIMKQYAEVDN